MKKLVCLCSFLFLNVFISVICSCQVSVQPEIILKKYLEKFSVSSESESLGFYSVAGLKQTNMYSFAVEKLKDKSLRIETYKRILKKVALQSELDVTNLFEIYNCKGGANAETIRGFYSDLSSYSGVLSKVLLIAEKTNNNYSKIPDYKNLVTSVSKADIKGLSNMVSVLSIIKNGAVVVNQANYLQQYYLLLTAASFDIGLQRMKELKSLNCITDQAFINALNETIEELQNYPKDFWGKLAATISDNKDVTYKGIESFFQVFNSSAQLYAQTLTLTAAESLSATAFLGWSSAAVAVISTIKMIKDWNQEWRDITLLGTIYTSLTQFGYSSMHYVDIVDFTQFLFLQKMAKCMENSNLVFWEYFKPDQKSVRLYVENDLGAITNAVVKKRVDSQLSCDNSDSFTDPRDGHVYKTVKIGNQVWMAENLAFKADEGCWAYNNNQNNVATYGYMYNLKTAINVCPSGWQLPSDSEWTTLSNYLGGDEIAGSKLKEQGISHWLSPNEGATDERDFTALPGGFRNYNGTFVGIGKFSSWWSSTLTSNSNGARGRDLSYNAKTVEKHWIGKECGLFVRCLNGEPFSEIIPTGGLLMSYSFDSDLIDKSGNNHNGTAQGTPQYVTSSSGRNQAARFNGNWRMVVNNSTPSNFSLKGDWTMAFSINPESGVSWGNGFIQRFYRTSNCIGFGIYLFDDPPANSNFVFNSGGLSINYSNLLFNSWNRIIVVHRRDQTADIYINGIKTHRNVSMIINETGSKQMSIGGNYNNEGCYGVGYANNLMLDDFTLFNIVLDSTQISNDNLNNPSGAEKLEMEKNVPTPNLSGSSETRKVRVHVTDFYNSPLINITVFFLNGTQPQKKTTDNFGEVVFDASPGAVNKIAAADLSGINKYGVAARRDYTEMLSNLHLKLPRYPVSSSEVSNMLDELVSTLLDAPDINEILAKLKEAQSSGLLISSPGPTLGAPGVFSIVPTIKNGEAGFILDGILINYLKGNLNCKSTRYNINYCSDAKNSY